MGATGGRLAQLRRRTTIAALGCFTPRRRGPVVVSDKDAGGALPDGPAAELSQSSRYSRVALAAYILLLHVWLLYQAA
jgi:hypothetical protein